MAIVRQVDSDYAGDNMVAFVQSAPRYRRHGPGGFGEMETGETYNVEVHHKPLDASGKAFAYCPHEHREIDAAVRCARRFMRTLSSEAALRRAGGDIEA